MKGLARTYVYWPKIDSEIEALVQKCKPCQMNANAQSVPVHPWMQPSAPWERVHIDYAGPYLQHSFLIVVDALTKWPEVYAVPSSRVNGTTSAATIEKLTECFARFGCPVTLVSDNGTQFASQEFAEFCKRNMIKHIFSAPYFPQSNGQAERFVQTLKRALRIAVLENTSEPLQKKLQVFLMAYRRAPTATGETPSQMMLNRNIRTRIDLLKSGETSRASDTKDIAPKRRVWFKTFRGPHNWEQGEVVRRIGNVMVEVLDSQGQIHRRHESQVRTDHTFAGEQRAEVSEPDDEWPEVTPAVREPEVAAPPNQDGDPVVPGDELQEQPQLAVPDLRRSSRERRPPNRLSP